MEADKSNREISITTKCGQQLAHAEKTSCYEAYFRYRHQNTTGNALYLKCCSIKKIFFVCVVKLQTSRNAKDCTKVRTFFSGSAHLVFCLSLFLILHISEVEQMQKLFSGFHFGGLPPMQPAYFWLLPEEQISYMINFFKNINNGRPK